MIEVRGVRKRLRRRWVLNGVDLTVHDGESVVIIGQSGTGKSVLLKHIIGLMTPDAGSVLVDGKDLSKLPERELHEVRRKIGYLFQNAALFDSLTVGENIALAISDEGDITRPGVLDIVREKLRMVGLKDVDSVQPSSLSGGMRKRVGLARALAMEPRYILYDEPTTGLDPVMADAINRLIRQLQKDHGVTSVTVTHDMHSAYFIGDRIAMLHEGRIIAQGTPQEIRNVPDPIVQQFIEGTSEGPLRTT